MSTRSASYQDLVRAVEQPGCPLCHIGQKTAHSYLDNLLWGSVNDPELRAELDKLLGFCGQHSRQMMTFQGERLGVAIVHHAMLKEALRRLQRVGAPQSRSLSQRLGLRRSGDGDDIPPAIEPAGQCPVCAKQVEIEGRALDALVENLVDDLDEPLRRSGGLCWEHLGLALQRCHDAPTQATLVELQSAAWGELVDHLAEFIRKRDYRFQHEQITDAEAASIGQSIAALTGQYPPVVD
ncbi:MAG: DUF6062 family protein [Caldilineales bacterium]